MTRLAHLLTGLVPLLSPIQAVQAQNADPSSVSVSVTELHIFSTAQSNNDATLRASVVHQANATAPAVLQLAGFTFCYDIDLGDVNPIRCDEIPATGVSTGHGVTVTAGPGSVRLVAGDEGKITTTHDAVIQIVPSGSSGGAPMPTYTIDTSLYVSILIIP